MKKILTAILFLSSILCASDHTYYFYNPEQDYGSELRFNPLTLWFNGSFDILRNGGHTKDIFNQYYKIGCTNVLENITHPIKNINEYGLNDFLHREIFNITTDSYESQFLPNIGLHLIGNGMQYVKLSEWYDYHQYPYPKLLSFATTTTYQLFNEIFENGNFVGTNVDPISDMLIFNPLGMLLFSTTTFKKFFSEKLPLLDWSLQPYYNPNNRFLENAGQQFASKLKLGEKSHYSLFFYWGVLSTGGFSYSLDDERSISFSAGAIVNKVNENRFRNARYMTPDLDYAFGFFYDKNNSLLLSSFLTGPKFYNIRVDIYPGLIEFGDFKPGFFLGIGEMDGLQFGLTCLFLPVGLLGQFVDSRMEYN